MTDIEKELLRIIDDLRAENAGLLDVILSSQGLLEEKVIVSAPATAGAVGKMPWYMRKRLLEDSFKLHKVVEGTEDHPAIYENEDGKLVAGKELK